MLQVQDILELLFVNFKNPIEVACSIELREIVKQGIL